MPSAKSNSDNRRRAPRAKLAQPVRIRPDDDHYPEEIATTANVSRGGFFFVTSLGHYYVGMGVSVTIGYRPKDPMNKEEAGEIVRIEKVGEDKWGVAIRVLMRTIA